MEDSWAAVGSVVTRKKKYAVVADLMRVRGIGEKYAETLYDKGIRSVQDLASAQWVPHGIKLLAKYVDEVDHDVDVRTAQAFLSWLEVTILLANAEHRPASGTSAEQVSPISRICDVIAVGSHRRGASSTHDIDVLIVYDDSSSTTAMSSTSASSAASTTAAASSTGSVAQSVSTALEEMLSPNPLYLGTIDRGEWKYSLLWRLKGVATIVDARLCPASERGAALLHTTGPSEFNIILRKRAIRMGMTLSEHGLSILVPGARGSAATNSEKRLVHAATEEGIFRALKLPYIPADQRNTDDGRTIVTRTPV